MKKYYVADRETGTFIVGVESIDEGIKSIEHNEDIDRACGIYESDFYEVVDENHHTVYSSYYGIDERKENEKVKPENKNLNHEYIDIRTLKCGKHIFNVKVGRKNYYLEITKNAYESFVEKYDCVGEFGTFSKYAADLKFLYVDNHTFIDRIFVESFDNVYTAVNTITRSSFGNHVKII